MSLAFVEIGTSIDDYNRAKKILDRARHPDFIGPQRFVRCVEKGKIIVATLDDQDVGVLMCEGETLTVLSVARDVQGQGVGQSLVRHADLKFVRAINDRVEWFERLGYERSGPPDMSHKKFVVQMMVRGEEGREPTTTKIAPQTNGKRIEKEHPDPGKPVLRIRYIQDLMTSGRYETGVTCDVLAKEWGLALTTVQTYSTQASRYLELLGSREHVLDRMRYHADSWVNESGPDRVSAAKLLLETVGGIVQRHEVRHELSGRSEPELISMFLTEIKKDPVLRDKALRYLQADGIDLFVLTDGESVE